MKPARLLPLTLFSASLMFGIWLGRQVPLALGHKLPAPTTAQAPHLSIETAPKTNHLQETAALRPLANGQINLLIIATHSGQLESILEIIYTENYPAILILPVYPSIPPRTADAALQQNFRLTTANRLDPGFLKLLQERNMVWSGYIVLDETATTAVSQALQPAGSETNTPASMLDSLCQHGQIAPLRTDLPTLYHDMRGHIGSDLELSRLSAAWQNQLQNEPAQTCEIITPQLPR